MDLLEWLRRRRKKERLEEKEAPPIDEEKEALERTGKLRTEIEEHIEEKPKRAKGKRKKESV